MNVRFKGNVSAKCYRGVNFVNEDKTEVTTEWFAACKNPNITEVKARAPLKAKEAKTDIELVDFVEVSE